MTYLEIAYERGQKDAMEKFAFIGRLMGGAAKTVAQTAPAATSALAGAAGTAAKQTLGQTIKSEAVKQAPSLALQAGLGIAPMMMGGGQPQQAPGSTTPQ